MADCLTGEHVRERHATVPHRRSAHAVPVAAFVLIPLLVAVYDFGRHGRSVRMVDEYFYHAHARSWYFDRDCDYDNDILMAPGFRLAPIYARQRTATGHLFNHFPTGTAITSFAWLAVGDVVTMAHNAVNDDPLPRDGYSRYYQMAVGFGHTLLGIAGLLAAYVLACRNLPRQIAAIAILAVLLGTNALYYIAVESTHSHADSIAWIALLFLLTDTVYRRGLDPVRGLLMGLVAGMMVATRPQDAVWAFVPVAVLTPMWLRSLARSDTRRRAAAFVVLAISGALLAYGPQLWVNRELHGTWLFNAYRAVEVQGHPAVLHWTEPDFLRPWLDPAVGLLWTSPLVLLAVPGVLYLAIAGWRSTLGAPRNEERRSPHTLAAIALGAIAMYYVVACVWWTFSGFGHRYLSSCTIAYVMGLGVVLTWASRRPWRAVVTGALLIAGVSYELGLLVAVNQGTLRNGAAAPLYAWLVGR